MMMMTLTTAITINGNDVDKYNDDGMKWWTLSILSYSGLLGKSSSSSSICIDIVSGPPYLITKLILNNLLIIIN